MEKPQPLSNPKGCGFSFLSTVGAAPAGAVFCQTGLNRKSGTIIGLHKVYGHRFDLIKQCLVNEVGDPVVVHDFVIIFRLIQSHAQRGSGSATLGHKNPDNALVILVFEEFLNHFVRFGCNLKHENLLFAFLSPGKNVGLNYAFKTACQLSLQKKGRFLYPPSSFSCCLSHSKTFSNSSRSFAMAFPL